MPTVNGRVEQLTPSLGDDDLVRAGKLAALGELTPGLAHELNNPLLAVLGLVELALAEAKPGSRAERRLATARDTTLELREILRALVAFARESPDTWGGVDLRETIEQAAGLVRRTSPARDVELVEPSRAEAAVVLGSRNELVQCLLHLLTNACTELRGGGTVRIELGASDGHATVAVSDSGPGVPADLRSRIFEPFFSTRPAGTGLGLAAARAIAERHGGTLELAERGGDGAATTFVLRLPLAVPEEAS